MQLHFCNMLQIVGHSLSEVYHYKTREKQFRPFGLFLPSGKRDQRKAKEITQLDRHSGDPLVLDLFAIADNGGRFAILHACSPDRSILTQMMANVLRDCQYCWTVAIVTAVQRQTVPPTPSQQHNGHSYRKHLANLRCGVVLRRSRLEIVWSKLRRIWRDTTPESVRSESVVVGLDVSNLRCCNCMQRKWRNCTGIMCILIVHRTRR